MTYSIRKHPSQHEYQDARSAVTVRIDGRNMGDIIEFPEPLGMSHAVVLTIAAAESAGRAPDERYSNGRFATHEGALNYMKLISNAWEG